MPGPKLYPPPPDVEGIPTKAELDALPRLNTWEDLKDIIGETFIPESSTVRMLIRDLQPVASLSSVSVSELGELGRGKVLQERYDKWMAGIRKQYGTTENYLIKARLPWKSASTSNGSLTNGTKHSISNGTSTHMNGNKPQEQHHVFEIGQEVDPDLYAVLPNDWPYNTPYDVEHVVVWSKLPIFHPALVEHDESKWARIQQDGFAGFTGNPETQAPPVTPPAGKRFSSLAESGPWGWCTEGGREVAKMVTTLWPEDEFECVWFVNPPRLQSVPGLSHFHVFARTK